MGVFFCPSLEFINIHTRWQNFVYINMLKLKIHPVFIALLAALALSGRGLLAAYSMLAVLIHEYAHYKVARWKCYVLNSLTLMPYGAVLYGKERFKAKDEAVIAAAGPLVNFAVAVLLLAVWWLFPQSYAFTLTFCKVNIAIAAFNLLPVYPLDGGRIVLSVAKNRLKALDILKKLGLIVSIVCAVLFMVSALGKINYTFAAASVVMGVSAFSGTRNERYIYLCSCLTCLEDFSRPVEIKKIAVKEDVPLRKILTEQKPFVVLELLIVDSEGNTIREVSGKQLESFTMNYPLSRTIGECISK